MQLFNKYKNDIFMEILKILNINSIDDLLSKKIRADVLKDAEILKKFNEMIPDIKVFYSSDKLTCLHHNSIYKQKNPGVNFLRQILKVHHYNLKSISIYKGLFQSKRVYSRYYFVQSSPSNRNKLTRSTSNPDISSINSSSIDMPNSVPNTKYLNKDFSNDISSSFLSNETKDNDDNNDFLTDFNNKSEYEDNEFPDNYHSFEFE